MAASRSSGDTLFARDGIPPTAQKPSIRYCKTVSRNCLKSLGWGTLAALGCVQSREKGAKTCFLLSLTEGFLGTSGVFRQFQRNCSRKSVGAPLFLAHRFPPLLPALQQVLECLQVGSHLAPDHPLKHQPHKPEEAARLRLDARREARPLRRRRLVGEVHSDRYWMSFPTPMGIAPVWLIVNDLEWGLEPAAQGLLHGLEPLALPFEWASSWCVFLAYLSDGCRPLGEVLWIGGVGEHLLHGPVYLDAFFDAY